MEFGAREIMIALGMLVALAIVLDVIRRIRAHRYESIRMPRRKHPLPDVDDDKSYDEFGSELPKGGARVVAYRNEDDIEHVGKSIKQAAEKTKPRLSSMAAKPTQETLAFEEPPIQDKSVAPETELPTKKRANTKQKKKAAPKRTAKDEELSNTVIALHVMAGKEQNFAGDQLKEALLANGLRYGSMKIFHRHENKDGSGDVLFSVANSVNPGTFDLNGMERFSSPGVSLFFSMSEVEDPGGVFDVMLHCAQVLADTLKGHVADDTRNTMTRQMIEHYRQRIAEFSRARFSR